ncbi:hypothetical protein PG1550B_0932 [Bifidobacterium pseudolongum subsp. globosum]|uniref:BREX system P-loop protein BrxC n=1 Tax=Bifidobacterium pseudolongum TaxID=1694 RepID=UPI0010221C72|nr:BREX system P-loop protein BrxC [Bifidobacterium pseudolongum]RYQ59861.1 hypothetical protein PG1550B_0932 [Bifidobacterium pseudolongum subsp. globosum]
MKTTVELKEIFAKDIDRRINGVIKAHDDRDLSQEIDEYVLTNEIQENLEKFFDAYDDPDNHVDNGAWISGFFGSGKSHLLKMLSYILGTVPDALIDKNGVPSIPSREHIVHTMMRKAHEQGNLELEGLLERSLRIPATSMLFNIDQKADKSKQAPLLFTFIDVFNAACGYCGGNRGVARFERDLDANGKYEAFKQAFEAHAGKPWEEGRDEAILWDMEIGQAYADVSGTAPQHDIIGRYEQGFSASVDSFTNDVVDWLGRQSLDHRVLFMVDEVGQFIGDSTQRMLDLQSIAEDLSVKTNGRAWIVVTSQENLDTIISDQNQRQGNDFSKIQGRFSIKLKLNSADTIEVIQKRLLDKKPAYIPELEELWEHEHDNMRTLFEFNAYTRFKNNDSGSESDFVASYPFLNYEFGLLQTAFRAMSDFGMFSGRHSSVGERSMLSAWSATLQTAADKHLGYLVPFDQLFDGIKDILQSSQTHRITEADQRLDPDVHDLGVRLLKVLLMVKHIEGFKTTPRNLRILLTDGFDVDVTDLERRIVDTLTVLENHTYVQRINDTYHYLTNEEQDIEQEIKNTDIEDNAVSKYLKDSFVDMVGAQSVVYGAQRTPFKYTLSIDGIAQGRAESIGLDLWTHVADDTDLIRRTSGDMHTISLLLNQRDINLFNDIRMIVKTNTFLRRNLDATDKPSTRQAIIAAKQAQRDTQERNVRSRVQEAIRSGSFYYNGKAVEVAGSDAPSKIVSAVSDVIKNFYHDYAMLGDLVCRDNEIDKYRSIGAGDEGGMLDGTNVEIRRVAQIANDIVDKVTRETNQKRTVSVKDLVDIYHEAPYGWPDDIILCMLAYLYGARRVELTIDAHAVANTQLTTLLRNTKKRESIVVTLPRQVDPTHAKRLEEFASAFFDNMRRDPSTDMMQFAQCVFDGIDDRLNTLETLKTTHREYAAIVNQLDEPIATLSYVARQPATWLLEGFTDTDSDYGYEAVLDEDEDVIRPILEFFNGKQFPMYVDSRRWLQNNRQNIDVCTDDAAKRLQTQAQTLLDSPDIYRGSRTKQLKTIVDDLRHIVDAQVGNEREAALYELDAITGELHDSAQFRNATEDAQHIADDMLHGERDWFASASDIGGIRMHREFMANQLRPNLYNDLAHHPKASTTERQEPHVGSATTPAHTPPTPKPVAQPHVIAIGAVAKPTGLTSLKTTDDVDEYLDAYRRKLIEAIENGNEILL